MRAFLSLLCVIVLASLMLGYIDHVAASSTVVSWARDVFAVSLLLVGLTVVIWFLNWSMEFVFFTVTMYFFLSFILMQSSVAPHMPSMLSSEKADWILALLFAVLAVIAGSVQSNHEDRPA